MTADDGPSKQEVASIATAVSAALAVVASLAVTGVLARAERNHGVWFLYGLFLILGGALLWFIAAQRPKNARRWKARRLRYAGGACFAFGLLWLAFVVITTQKEGQRPAVSGSFNAAKNALSVKVTAEGLGTDQRMTISVDGLENRGDTSELVAPEPKKPLYYALLGPDADGKVKYEFTVSVPSRFTIVGVEGWTANERPRCYDAENHHRQSEEAGCAVIRLGE